MRKRILVAAVALAVLAAACSGGSKLAAPPPTGASPAETGTATAIEPSPGPSAVATTPPTPISVTGLVAASTLGRPAVRVAVLGSRPESSFKPWDGKETVIYDVVAGREIDLGEGSGATFSPDSRWAGWIAGPETTDAYGLPERIGEAWVMNLESGEKHDLGRGRAVRFDVAPKVSVFPPERDRWNVFDYQTGRPMADQTTQGPLGYRVLPDGSQLWTEALAPITPVNARGGFWTSRFSVRRGGDQSLVMDFEAMTAMPAGQGKLLVVMPPVNGDSNLFLLDLTTGEAAPLTSARPGVGPNWPISATGEYALWTDDFCSERPGNIEFFDLQARTLTEIRLPAQSTENERSVLLTPGGQIAQGSFGAKAIIDSRTLAYLAVLPATPQDGRGSEPAWSSDYRYASYYRAGHGGLCSG
jgi:hypothetical protein